MTLNTTGPISLGQGPVGTSIQRELMLMGPISLSSAVTRKLANVATGPITMATNFYGKANTYMVNYSAVAGGEEAVVTIPEAVAMEAAVAQEGCCQMLLRCCLELCSQSRLVPAVQDILMAHRPLRAVIPPFQGPVSLRLL